MQFDLVEIGVVSSPFERISDCPPTLYGRRDHLCRVEIHGDYLLGITGLNVGDRIHVLWWANLADRSAVLCEPRPGDTLGVFSSRCPDRPNPIALSTAMVVKIDSEALIVSGLECLNGTSVIDIKKCILMEDGQWI